jgi:hypothetical protein
VAGVRRGYHKPIMIAGGLGAISDGQTKKLPFGAGTLLIQLGGPGMRIGMGGGAASSMAAGTNTAALDFDSVQRGNPEIQRRAQEVINHCWALGEANPILAIHDVGAGGLSNAFPELVDGAGKGAVFDLRKVPLEESGLAPKEIWCNESQERYVLAIDPARLPAFQAMWPPTTPNWCSKTAPAARARSTCRWRCCSASRRRCTATWPACRAPAPRWTSPACRWKRPRSTCCAIPRWPASVS